MFVEPSSYSSFSSSSDIFNLSRGFIGIPRIPNFPLRIPEAVKRRSLLNFEMVSLGDMASVATRCLPADRWETLAQEFSRRAVRPSSQVEVRRRGGGVVRFRAGASGRRGCAGPAASPGSRQRRATSHVGAALRTAAGATAAALLRRMSGCVSVAIVVRGIYNKKRLRSSRKWNLLVSLVSAYNTLFNIARRFAIISNFYHVYTC